MLLSPGGAQLFGERHRAVRAVRRRQLEEHRQVHARRARRSCRRTRWQQRLNGVEPSRSTGTAPRRRAAPSTAASMPRLGLGARLADAHADRAHVELCRPPARPRRPCPRAASPCVTTTTACYAHRTSLIPAALAPDRGAEPSKGGASAAVCASSCTTATDRCRPPVQPTATVKYALPSRSARGSRNSSRLSALSRNSRASALSSTKLATAGLLARRRRERLHEVRVGQEAHVEHQVGLGRQAVLEAERQAASPPARRPSGGSAPG